MRKLLRIPAAILLAAAVASAPGMATQDGPTARVEGVVTDETGAPLSGIVVWLTAPNTRLRQTTDAMGQFGFEPVPLRPATLLVDAPGFQRLIRSVEPADSTQPVRLTLVPASIAEQVTVTATRHETRLADTASSVVVLNAEDLSASAAPALDDALRQVPGFSLFRRSGSRTANPTSQGVSLRGVGASGASRAVVLDDGVPLNDPFGGWVYWGRVPRASVERVEVLRGGASDLYGSAALGGAIQLLRRSAATPFALGLETSYGSLDTPEASIFGAIRRDAWGVSLAAEAFRTDGYVAVDEDERGPVDTRVSSRHTTVDLTVEHSGAAGRAYLRGSTFDESRGNGTPLQENDTETRQLALGGDWRVAAGALALRSYATRQEFHQSFSAIAADRQSERLTRLQSVPSDAGGVSVQWSGAVHPAHVLLAGAEGRQVEGETREEIFTDSGSTLVDAGGRERTGALFLEDIFTAGARLTVTAGLRLDRWWNEQGHSSTRPTRDATPSRTRLPDRSETAWSPRVLALYRVSDAIALSASGYESFRAPTLNELYRSFRVGNVLTLANAELDAERLRGVEAGIMLAPSPRLSARGALFWMEVEDAIGNVTVSVTPALITRSRQNIGRTRSRGVEVDFDARLTAAWRIAGGYQFADSVVRSFPREPQLAGRRVPQVPRHRLTLQSVYANPSIANVAISARWTSSQFEDDQNTLALSSFWTLDAVVSRSLWRGLDAFLAAENLLDEPYEIGRTPVRTLGPRRLWRGGFRVRLP